MGRDEIISQAVKQEFSRRLKRFVEYNSLTHIEAGKLLGVSPQTIGNYIAGRSAPIKYSLMNMIMENSTRINRLSTQKAVEDIMEFQDRTGVKTSQIAEVLAVSPKTIYRWANGDILISEKQLKRIRRMRATGLKNFISRRHYK